MPPVKNVTCVKRHCGSEISACLADQTCVDNFKCSGGCGSDNSSCTFQCSESYRCSTQDALMFCMFQENECLTLPEPTDPLNNATCRKPTNFVVPGID